MSPLRGGGSATVRPFQFTGLPRFSAAQVALQESFANYLASRPYAPDFRQSLGQLLQQYLKAPCDLSGFELRPVGRHEVAALLPKYPCLVVVALGPSEHKILLDLDPSMANFAIERLLGGSGEGGALQRPLTEIEEGVLSFLLLKVLAHFHAGLQSGRELALCLERFCPSVDDVQDILDQQSTFHALGARISAGKRVGYVRLFIPDALVSASFAAPVPQSGATSQELAHMRTMLNSLGEKVVLCRVEAAKLDLTPDDIGQLELGDIVILENHQLVRTEEGIGGEVFVRLGAGQNGGLRGHLLVGGDQAKLQITAIVQQEQPQPGAENMADASDMDDQHAPQAEADNLPETEGLLRDVPAPVVVELGRIQLNTAQVIRLRAGQVLRLPRGPNDPVDLVVNDKLFARGELIEVDGELGVRLVHVVGQSGA